MFVDLDRFKAVNDRTATARAMKCCACSPPGCAAGVRGDDIVGRIGGDEFLVLCPNVGGAEQAMRLAARLSETLSEDVPLASATISHQISVGVAWSDGAGADADELVARADAAMYESKRERAGRPRLAGARPQPRRAPARAAPLRPAPSAERPARGRRRARTAAAKRQPPFAGAGASRRRRHAAVRALHAPVATAAAVRRCSARTVRGPRRRVRPPRRGRPASPAAAQALRGWAVQESNLQPWA